MRAGTIALSLLLTTCAALALAAPVRAVQFHDDFESPAQLAHWSAWANVQPIKMELASPGYQSKTCLRVTVPKSDWDTATVTFPTPIRVTDRTMVRFRVRLAPGMVEGINVRDATEGDEYLLTFPFPGSGWTVVQRYLKSAVYKRFGKPGVPKNGVVGDEVSSLQIAYMGTDMSVDDFEIFEAKTNLPELPPDELLPKGSYHPHHYPCLDTVFPFGVISTVAAGDGANAALFGQTSDERFEDDLLDLKRHGMNAISDFCDDNRVAWRLSLMAKYRLYDVDTALSNLDLRAAKPGDPNLRLIAENRNNPWLLAWYGHDEPSDCMAYLDNKRVINAADPNHPVASAFSQMPVAKRLGPYMELMMLDPYSVFRPERTIAQLAFHADLIRQAKKFCHNRKVWMIAQTFSWRHAKTTSWRMPDPSEIRYDVFNCIGAGADGFLFFIYNDECTYLDGALRGEEFDDTLVDPWGNACPTYEALSELARVLVPSMPVVLDAVEPTDGLPKIDYEAAKLSLGRLRDAKADYVVLTSNDLLGWYRGTAKIALKPGRRIYDLLSLRQVPVRDDGSFDLDLPPGGGVILMLTTPAEWRQVRHGIVVRRVEADKQRLAVECEVLKAQGIDVRAIEAALGRVGLEHRTGAGLERVREMVADARRSKPGLAEMNKALDRAQQGFGDINRLIRPVVADVDGTKDPAWLDALSRLKALSVTYFKLRREFKAGDVSHRAEVGKLLADEDALRTTVAALAGR